MRRFSFTRLLLLAAISMSACGGKVEVNSAQDASAPGSGGSLSAGGSAGLGGSPGTGGASGTGGSLDASPDQGEDGSGGSENCSAKDWNLLVASFDGGTFQDVVFTCGKLCLGSADSHGCTRDCIVKSTGITVTCADCSAVHIECVIENCLAECITDQQSTGCVKCRCLAVVGQPVSCEKDYEVCTGLPTTVCEPS